MTAYRILEFYLRRIDFMVEMTVACAFFVTRFPKRKHFIPKAILSLVMTFLLFILWDPKKLNAWYFDCIRFLLAFIYVDLSVFICYKVPPKKAIFATVNAYNLQFVSYKVYELCIMVFGYAKILKFFIPFYLLIHGTVYGITYFFYIRKIRRYMNTVKTDNSILVVFIGFVLYSIVYNNFSLKFSQVLSPIYYLIVQCVSFLSGILFFILLYYIAKNTSNDEDRKFLQYLIHRQKEQYEELKEKQEILNIKCHDLKHIIASDNAPAEKQYLSELKKDIDGYDSLVETGNTALNIVLSEKSVVCDKKNIRFTFIAEGTALDSVMESDIYSLFGNILDNAIRAVQTLDEHLRIISLTIRKDKGLCIIHCENPYQGIIEFENGIPKTTKDDKDYHGFGLKSIKMIVRKYSGESVISAEEDRKVFNIDITLPLPQENKASLKA